MVTVRPGRVKTAHLLVHLLFQTVALPTLRAAGPLGWSQHIK
jgi:hypothetical protein